MSVPEGQEQFQPTALTRSRDAAIERVGEDAVYNMVLGGMTHREIADSLGLDGSDRNTRAAVYQWLVRDRERYDAAKRASVDALADEASEIYGTDTPATSADAKFRNDRAGHMRWLAEMRNPSLRKDGLHVTIGELHLAALQQAGSANRLQAGDEPETIEAEWTEEGEA